MNQLHCIAFAAVLKATPDPRDPRGCRYAWWFLLTVIASALLSGKRSARGIAQWAQWRRSQFRGYFGLEYRRMPSAPTIRRTLSGLDIGLFEREMAAFTRRIEESTASGQDASWLQRGLALDGKDLRTASAYGESVALLSGVRHRSGVTLAQQTIPSEQGEVTVAYRLLAQQPLMNQVVTMDAGFKGHKLLQQIIDQDGDYLIVVKRNCPQLYADIADLWQEEEWLEDLDRYAYTERGHGRIDTHITTCSTDLNNYLRWPGIQQVIKRVRISQEVKTGQVSTHVTYAMTSLAPDQARAQTLEKLWRGHWSIEAKSHYVRDVTFGEDRCRIRTGSAPEALAALRNGLLALLRPQDWETIPDAIRYYEASLQKTLHALGF